MTIAHRLLTGAAVICLATTPGAQISDRARTESQARRASERLVALQREAEGLAKQQRTLLVDLRRLEVERDLRNEQVRQIEVEAQTLGRELGNIGNQIDALEAEAAATRPILESRMVELYKLGGAGYVRLLFNASNLREFGRAYRMVAAVASLDRVRAEQHKLNLERLRQAQRSLRDRRSQMAKLQQAAVAARAAADRATREHAALIADIDRRRDLTAELASELQGAQVKLQQTLSAINAGGPRPAADPSALPIRPFRGDLDWPVSGRVMGPFARGSSAAVRSQTQNGIQIAAQEGVPVEAIHDGTVAYAGPFTGYGTLVIVDHGAQTYSLYGQLGSAQVERGAKIESGDAVGTVGRNLAGFPGMYFEMRVDGKPVDPLEWLKRR